MRDKEDKSDVEEGSSEEEQKDQEKLEKKLRAGGGIAEPKRGARQHRRSGGMERLPDVGQHHDFNKPAIAMTREGKQVQRWERGGESHWIEGHSRFIEGKKYRLIEVRRTAGVNYLIVERAK